MFDPFHFMKEAKQMVHRNVFTSNSKTLTFGAATLAVALGGASAQAGVVVYDETFDNDSGDRSIDQIATGWDGWAGGDGNAIDETSTANNHNGVFSSIVNRDGGTGGLSTPDSIRHNDMGLTAPAIPGRVLLFTTDASFTQPFTASQLQSIEFDASANNAFTMRPLVHVDVSNDGIRDDNEWYVSDAFTVEPTAGGFNGSFTTVSVDQTLNPDWTQVDLNPGTTLDLTANVGALPGGDVLAVGFYTDEGDVLSLGDGIGGPDNNAKYAVDNYTVSLIPEPASMAFFAAGAGMILWRRRGR